MSNAISEQALKLFAHDLESYSKVCLNIRTKGGWNPKKKIVEPPQLMPLVFNESQTLVHEILADQYARTQRIRAIILKARQQGMSTYTAARFFRKLHLWPNHQAVVVADELERAQTLYGMYDRFANHLPDEMKPMMRYVSKKKEMVLDNPKDALRAQQPGLGSGISVETAGDTEAGRGSTIQLAHLSEMASWPNALDVYISLIQAVPDLGSEVIVESTAKGVGNLFHQMWKQAQEGDGLTEGSNGFIAVFIPWWWSKEYRLRLKKREKQLIRDTMDDYEKLAFEVGFTFRGEVYRLDEEQLGWRRRTIREKAHGDERAFRQEYPATPEEAFIASGAQFFDEDALHKYATLAKPPKRRAMLVSVQNSGIRCQATELGWLRIWKMPGADDNENSRLRSRYIISADTATGRQVAAQRSLLDDPESERGGRDFSCADVIDVVRREQVAQIHARMAPEIFAEQLNLLGKFYAHEQPTGLRDPALLVVERNHNSGETVIRLLKDKYRYPNLFYMRTIARRFDKKGERAGWITNVETRMPMLDNLAALLRDEMLVIPCKETIEEMLVFVRGEDGKPQAQEGAHDDRVISLGIGAYVMDITQFEEPKNWDRTELVKTGTSPTGMFSW